MSRIATPDTSTPAGKALLAASFLVSLGLIAWIILGPLDGFSESRVSKGGVLTLLVLGIPIGFFAFVILAFLVFAAIGAILEIAGFPLERLAPRAPPPTVPRAPETDPRGLDAEEASRARDVGVYCLIAYGTDSSGWPEAPLQTVACCLNAADLEREHSTRPIEPGWDGFKTAGPVSLLRLLEEGRVTAGEAREFLRRIDAGEPWQPLDPPLSPEERAAAAGVQVWYVQYEDNFGTGGQRDGFSVAVCLSEEEARTAVASYGRPLQPGADGYEVRGPYRLDQEGRPGVVREVLARAASRRGGAVSIDSRLR